MLHFVHPAWLLALLLLPLLWFLLGRPGPRSALLFSNLDLFGNAGKPVRRRLGGWKFLALLSLACACWIVALARPHSAETWEEAESSGIEIMMALDVSQSMAAPDFVDDRGGVITRLDLACRLSEQFIRDRAGDRIGLLVFSGRPALICPSTTNRSWLLQQGLPLAQQTRPELEEGTAIGSALAAASLHLSEPQALPLPAASPRDANEDSHEVPPETAAAEAITTPGAKGSRIIVLITDGASNAGELQPLEAASIAARLGVRIYTIAVGSPGEKPVPIEIDGRTQVARIDSYDETTLREIARLGHGEFFQASDRQGLENAFHTIDQLEKSDIETVTLVKRHEHFPHWISAGLLLAALGLVLRPFTDRRLPE